MNYNSIFLDYQSKLLDAFALDLAAREFAGASDLSFSGQTGEVKVHKRGQYKSQSETGIPQVILSHIVEGIFGVSHFGTTMWRGYRMSAKQTDIVSLTDMLVVRLDMSDPSESTNQHRQMPEPPNNQLVEAPKVPDSVRIAAARVREDLGPE